MTAGAAAAAAPSSIVPSNETPSARTPARPHSSRDVPARLWRREPPVTTRAARAARAPPAVIRAGEGSLRTDDQREDARQGRGRPETRARFLRCASALGSTRRASSASASTRAPRQAAGCEALSWPPRRGSFAASEATSVPAKGKAIVKKSASGWPTGGRRMSDRADATHRHRSRCRRRTARARASDCHPLGTKVNCLSWWALTCPRERQPENIRSRSVIESYIRTRHELAPVHYSPSCAVVPARYSNPTALVLAKKGELLVRYSFLVVFLLVRYSYLVVFLLVHGRVKKTRTRPWTGTGQVRLRARTSTGSARCRRLPEVELAHELELVRGLSLSPLRCGRWPARWVRAISLFRSFLYVPGPGV